MEKNPKSFDNSLKYIELVLERIISEQ